MTEEIKHINEKNQEYIAEGNRMTKEIIIDGVNVAGCKLYDYGICDSEMADDLNCDKNHTCYYKQFKRLEQENKELKSQASLYENLYNHHGELVTDYRKQRGRAILYKSFLEELLYLLKTEEPFCYCSCGDEIIDRINEVLDD